MGARSFPKLILAAALATAALSLTACDGGSDASPTVAIGGRTPTAPPAAQASTTPPPSLDSPPAATCGSGGSSGIGAIQRTGQRNFSGPPARVIDPARTYVARIETDKGEIRLLLAAQDVPNHSNNFVFLACTGFYDGLVFHRVELNPPFVIQTGDPVGNGSGGPGYQVPLEISPKWRHDAGALGMARSAGLNTAGSQFYITLSRQPSLDNQYTVFGRVIAGMDVVNQVRLNDRMLRVDIEER